MGSPKARGLMSDVGFEEGTFGKFQNFPKV